MRVGNVMMAALTKQRVALKRLLRAPSGSPEFRGCVDYIWCCARRRFRLVAHDDERRSIEAIRGGRTMGPYDPGLGMAPRPVDPPRCF
jgi:hypothetical protein